MRVGLFLEQRRHAGEGLLVLRRLLEGGQQDQLAVRHETTRVARQWLPLTAVLLDHRGPAHVGELGQRLAGTQPVGDRPSGSLPHAKDQEIRLGVEQHRPGY